ncbi:transposase [Candidatus Woesearchaeota archaeon]|nr:transposase [Candidatus Woesearchaeota archaeon]
MRIKVCPRCGSSNISLFIGGTTGSYECKDCGYIGPLIIDKEMFKK